MRFFTHGILVLLALAPYCPGAQQESDVNTLQITLDDTKYFPGHYSLTPEEIFLALKHSTYGEKFMVLEFGAGESTFQLTKLLTKKNVPFEYHVFENDPLYIKYIDHVTYHYYFLPNVPCPFSEWANIVDQYTMPELPVFDLVIVDGPHGVARAQWYSKFKKYVKPGTVILIDDFHHYNEFGNALDKNFKYTTVIEYNQCPSWKIINTGLEHLNTQANKTFKIVKVQQRIGE